MTEQWDKFPSNLCEQLGKIERKPFTFKYERIEVWQIQQCVFSAKTSGVLYSKIDNQILIVTVDSPILDNFMMRTFEFKEISTNMDRIIWSKDLFSTTGITEESNPDVASLFFKKGILSKIAFLIHDPGVMIEFYSS